MECLSGLVLTPDGFEEGYVIVEDGIVSEIGSGKLPSKPSAEGLVMPAPVNSHTHCADGNVKVVRGMTIEQLVAPPDGLKHKYLRNAPDAELSASMRGFAEASAGFGVSRFIDFREGGVKGCKLLRDAVPDAVVLGRPVSPEFDPDEVHEILEIADGIGLSSISDVDYRYAERVADAVREKRKIFAIHASERVREDIDAVLSLDPAFVVHMTEATDGDMLKCSESEVPAVVCPRSNAFFGKRPPLKRMLDCGMDLSIGTDNAMLCNPDLRLDAELFAGILSRDGGDASQVWKAMSFNSRKLIHRGDMVRLRVGGPADLAVLPCGDLKNPLCALSDGRPVPAYGNRKRLI